MNEHLPTQLCLRNKNLHCFRGCLRTPPRTVKYQVVSLRDFIRSSLEYIMPCIQKKTMLKWTTIIGQNDVAILLGSPRSVGAITDLNFFRWDFWEVQWPKNGFKNIKNTLWLFQNCRNPNGIPRFSQLVTGWLSRQVDEWPCDIWKILVFPPRLHDWRLSLQFVDSAGQGGGGLGLTWSVHFWPVNLVRTSSVPLYEK